MKWRRSLRIPGLNSDLLPSLETRRDKASSREFERICKDLEHPCHKLLPDKVMNPYDLQRDSREQSRRENSRGPGQNYIWDPYNVIILKQQD